MPKKLKSFVCGEWCWSETSWQPINTSGGFLRGLDSNEREVSCHRGVRQVLITQSFEVANNSHSAAAGGVKSLSTLMCLWGVELAHRNHARLPPRQRCLGKSNRHNYLYVSI